MAQERFEFLLTTSAAVFFAAATALLFAPEEILSFVGVEGTGFDRALLQMIAAALFGFSMLNWMNRRSRIGGIYGRPVVVANFSHAAIATAMLVRVVPGSETRWSAWAVLSAYALLTVAFAWKLFHSPRPVDEGGERSPV